MKNFRILDCPNGDIAVYFNYDGMATQFGMIDNLWKDWSRKVKI